MSQASPMNFGLKCESHKKRNKSKKNTVKDDRANETFLEVIITRQLLSFAKKTKSKEMMPKERKTKERSLPSK
jgi:hypothetical protein